MEANQREVHFDWFKVLGTALFYLKLSFIYVADYVDGVKERIIVSITESERIMFCIQKGTQMHYAYYHGRLEVDFKQMNIFRYLLQVFLLILFFLLFCCCYQTFLHRILIIMNLVIKKNKNRHIYIMFMFSSFEF